MAKYWIIMGILTTVGLFILEFGKNEGLAYLSFAWIIPAMILVLANLYFGATDEN